MLLNCNYFFEFAGMPQAGKTKIITIVAHYLRRIGYLVQMYNGGSEYSSLHDAPIADLNLSLACQTVDFVVNKDKRERGEHKIYLLDRGLIDRSIFTKALSRDGKIGEVEAHTICAFLNQPRLLKCLNGVYIFITSPRIALEREYEDKIIESPGEVMQTHFLSTLYQVAVETHEKTKSSSLNVHLIDTEQLDTKTRKTAKDIAEDILGVVKKTEGSYSYLTLS